MNLLKSAFPSIRQHLGAFLVSVPGSKNPWRRATTSYVLVFLLLTFPYWFLGEVIAPHRQSAELAAVDPSPGRGDLENRKFSDFTSAYIPEIKANLDGARSGWLTLWTTQNELGRPTYHLSGFSPAYLPTWILSLCTSDPWRLITVLSLSFCFLSGVFLLLFSREAGLYPIAGLVSGLSIATCPLFMYWLTFPMFPAVWCWAAGALWAVTRLSNRLDLVGWAVLSFSVYSLLMTAYPQPVVYHAYILGLYGAVLAWRQARVDATRVARFIALSASAVLIGAGLAFPVYRDTWVLSSESARVAPDISFFTVVLPRIQNLRDIGQFVALSTVPEIFGNPISPEYPFSYDGLSLSVLIIFFATVTFWCAFRGTWPWWLAITLLCCLAFNHGLFAFSVTHFGFNLSRSSPLGSVLLPFVVIQAFGVDVLAKLPQAHRTRYGVLAGGLLVLLILVGAIWVGISRGVVLHRATIVAILVAIVCVVAQYNRFRPLLVLASQGVFIFISSYPLMLRQSPTNVVMTSPLVEMVRHHLPSGSRYAVSAPAIPFLPANLNATVDLASLHSYNSLSSTRYHTLIRALGGEMHTYGRYNGTINPDYNGAMFWMSNVGLILAPSKLVHPNLEYVGEQSSVYAHRVVSRMGHALQIILNPVPTEGRESRIDPRELHRHISVKQVDRGDLLEYAVERSPPSFLVLSQKFHRDWKASVFSENHWISVPTIEVNGVFQGVELPSNVDRVRLTFRPWSRFAWLGHLVWGVLSLVIVVRFLRKRRRTFGETT